MKLGYTKNTKLGFMFDIFNVFIMCCVIFVMVYPFWNQLVVSLNDGIDGQRGGLYFWPRLFSLESYKFIFGSKGLSRAMMWSIIRVVVGTTSCLFCTGLVAYITTIRWFSAHRLLRRVFIISMYFSGGMIPVYLWYMNIGLVESFHVYWLPGLVSAYYMMLIAAYIFGLPEAMTESARIDGANEINIYLRIIIPMSIPIYAALAIMVAVEHWNSWFDVMLYNSSGKYNTMQMLLREILLRSDYIKQMMSDSASSSDEVRQLAQSITSNSMRAATTMIVTIPIVFVYPFFQKYFIKGISVGAVKG